MHIRLQTPGRTATATAVVLALASSTARADVPDYRTFDLQVRSNIVDGFNLPPGSSFNSGTPAINDDAVVALRLLVVGDSGRSGLWVGSRGVGGVVHELPEERLAGDPSINDLGVVVFEQFDLFTDGIFRYDPRSGSTALAVEPGPYSSIAAPTVNDDGAIGFRGQIGFDGRVFVVADGDDQDEYAAESSVDPSSPYGFLFTPDFNDAAQIAGKARVGGTANDLPDEIRRWSADGTSVLIATDDDGDARSPFTGFDNGVALADNGLVAFVAGLVGGGRGVYVGDGTAPPVEIATTADPALSAIEFFHPAVNDAGLVAFRGRDAAGLDAVFVGDGTTLVRVIGEHDIIPTDLGDARIDQHDGSVTFGGSIDMNASGDLAFICTLTPPDDNQVEWGSGLFVAYADEVAADPDVNGDGVVDVDDLVAVILAWGAPGGPADVNGDGTVDVDDLVLVILGWS